MISKSAKDLDEYKSIGSYWIDFCVNDDNVTYFDSSWVEHIPKEIKNFTGNKTILLLGFLKFTLKGKSLLH